MKRIALPLFLLLSVLISTAQEVKWDSTHRPNSFVLKADQFRSYPDSRKDIIFLGNSITAGTDWMELLGNKNMRNRGISGDITFGVLERLNEVTSGKPACVFILIGINDVARGIPDSVILHNYHRIIRRIKTESPGTKIYFHTLLPVNNEFTPSRNHFNRDEHILYINKELKKMGESERITIIDLYTPFLDASNKLDKKYTYDGLHLNAAGYLKWAEILKKYLD